ncbi:MAG TPA: GNAT family N-acetyltransferase [Acidimicrobiales bacterium]|jgi:ribosomal protein S18 acetylase RimI-like enzyme|nr:GNAT family N-acetyltransferase [Acidimicrobiales bacterium]
MTVRPLEPRDVDAVAARVKARLSDDARRNPLLNANFSIEHFSRALRDAMDQTWVSHSDGIVTGHLYGARLDSVEYGNGVWIGPDGVSFDNADQLVDLYATAGEAWIEQGALEHYAWVFDEPADTAPWYELGFARMHVRGVLSLDATRPHRLPTGYSLRRGGPDDLALALVIDETLDAAQRRGPSFSISFEHTSRADEMLEALEDDEVHYYVVESSGVGVAQCLTFPLEARRGSFDDTLHVSAVAVVPGHEHRGVARALIDHALNDALAAGFGHVETNWRVTNRRANDFWVRYGFRPTYVRLHRTIGSG